LSSLSDTSALTKTNIAKNQLEAEVNICNVVLMNDGKLQNTWGRYRKYKKINNHVAHQRKSLTNTKFNLLPTVYLLVSDFSHEPG
jgi:hypothetical protein